MAKVIKILEDGARQGDWIGQVQLRDDGRKIFVQQKYVGGSGASEMPVTDGVKTGNDTLDEMLRALEVSLRNNIKGGNVLNENIEISPSKTQEFLEQAQREIDPYYQSQYKLIRESLGSSLSELQAEFELADKQRAKGFDQNVRGFQDQLSETGGAISGQRVRGESDLVGDYQDTSTAAIRRASAAAQDAIRRTEQQVGSKNLKGAGFEAPNIQGTDYGSFTAGQTFIQGYNPAKTQAKPLFNLSDDVTGSIEEEQKRATLLRQNELKAEYAAKEARRLYNNIEEK